MIQEILDEFAQEMITTVNKMYAETGKLIPTIFSLHIDSNEARIDMFQDFPLFMYNKVTRKYIDEIVEDYINTEKPLATVFVSEAMAAKVDMSKIPAGKEPTPEDVKDAELQPIVYVHFETKKNHYVHTMFIDSTGDKPVLTEGFDTGWIPKDLNTPPSLMNIMGSAKYDFESLDLNRQPKSPEEALQMSVLRTQLGRKSNDIN
jgi:hypothetical protein